MKKKVDYTPDKKTPLILTIDPNKQNPGSPVDQTKAAGLSRDDPMGFFGFPILLSLLMEEIRRTTWDGAKTLSHSAVLDAEKKHV